MGSHGGRGGDIEEDSLASFRVGGEENDSQILMGYNRVSKRVRHSVCHKPASYWFCLKTSAQRGTQVFWHRRASSVDVLVGTSGMRWRRIE